MSTPSVVSTTKYIWQCTAAFAELCRYGTAELDADNDDIAYYFHSHREPTVTLTDYIRRVEAEVRCGEDGFYIALILVGRACNDRRSPKVLLPSVLTAHRLFLTGLRVASKMHHDIYRSNRTFAKLGGVTNQELNQLEFLMLERLGFNAMVTPQELERVKSAVRTASAAGTSTTVAARLLATGIGLDIVSRQSLPTLVLPEKDDAIPSPASQSLLRPSSSLSFNIDSSPSSPLTPASGCGRSAVRTLRLGRLSTSGTFSSAVSTPLKLSARSDRQTLNTSSSLLLSVSHRSRSPITPESSRRLSATTAIKR